MKPGTDANQQMSVIYKMDRVGVRVR